MSSLFFRSLFVLSLVTTLSTPLFAQESVEEVDASPVVFTNDTLSVVEGNTAFVRLTADDIQETTRVRVRITPDTARSGTDYRNPGIVTVTFYKNGVNNKRIGVRTINRSGVQGERSFTASIISINGKAVPADTGEMMEVTITDRGSRTTTTGTTSSQEQVRGNGGASVSVPAVTQPVTTSTTTSRTPTPAELLAEDCSQVKIPEGYQKGFLERLPLLNRGNIPGFTNGSRTRIPAYTIISREYKDIEDLPRIVGQYTNPPVGSRIAFVSDEITSNAPRICRDSNGMPIPGGGLCENDEAGNPNYGLSGVRVAFSQCPYQMDPPNPACTSRHYVSGGWHGGAATLSMVAHSYKHPIIYSYWEVVNSRTVDRVTYTRFGESSDVCWYDPDKPLYMNIQGRCFEENRIDQAACLLLFRAQIL